MEEKSIGIGLLRLSFSNNYPLYRTFDAEQPFDTLIFKHNPDGTFNFTTQNPSNTLQPYHMFRGDSYKEAHEFIQMGLVGSPAELVFRVIQKTEGSHLMEWDAEHQENIFAPDKFLSQFLIILNEETGGSAALKTTYSITPFWNEGGLSIYESWDQYLKRVEFIQPLRGEYLLYDKPEGIVVFKHTETPFLRVLAVEGEYVKAVLDTGRPWVKNLKDAENRIFPAESWLRWRDGGSLLIRIVEFTIE